MGNLADGPERDIPRAKPQEGEHAVITGSVDGNQASNACRDEVYSGLRLKSQELALKETFKPEQVASNEPYEPKGDYLKGTMDHLKGEPKVGLADNMRVTDLKIPTQQFDFKMPTGDGSKGMYFGSGNQDLDTRVKSMSAMLNSARLEA